MGDNLPIIDRPVLAKLQSDVGDESAAFLVQSLKEEIRSGAHVLEEFASARNMSRLENQAHALKSAVRSFGALRLGAICMALEESAKAEKPEQVIAGLLADFKRISNETIAAFDQN